MAIDSIADLYKKGSQVKLDIYGPVDSGYKKEFEKLLAEHRDCVEYKGIIEQDMIQKTLSKYYMLLFPTFWKGEGFAGTILDAFASGIPTIASDWNCNAEIITNLKTGLVYPSDTFDNFKDALEYSVANKHTIIEMRKNSLNEYNKYLPDNLIKKVIDYIQSLND